MSVLTRISHHIRLRLRQRGPAPHALAPLRDEGGESCGLSPLPPQPRRTRDALARHPRVVEAPASVESPVSPASPAGSGHVLTALLRVYALFACVTTLGRAGLYLWLSERLADIPPAERWMAFVHGLRMDTIAFGYLLALPCIALCLSPSAWRQVVAPATRGFVLAAVLVLLLVEIATFPFFAQYDARPNFLFTAYVEYPREVSAMLWKDHKLELALQLLAASAIAYGYYRVRAFASFGALLARPWPRRAAWFLPAAALLFLGIRSSLGHRPANLSDACYSNNRVAGEIAKNSVFSVAYEAYRGRQDDERLARAYGRLPMDEAYRRTHALLGMPVDRARPFQRVVPARVATERPRNLVIVVQESMGAQFVGFLGDERRLTPRIDALAEEGLAFTELYSNGTRSIRGLGAMSSGFQPLLGDGELKRPKSQSDFFSLASLLEPHGYQTSFIYGGEARFDNMRGWYLGNGFDRVIEERDFDARAFRSSWGVGDEDLLGKANEVFREQHASGRPFASVVFTSSNHAPFELPDDRIEWVAGVPRASVENAIRYADYSVGRFFDAARNEAYYDHTIFVVVADHNVRVYGDDVVPVNGFHIPGIIVGKGVEPRRHDELCSQPDVLATALGELGLTLEYPILGNPIDVEPRERFVMMQFNDTYGFRRGDQVAVLRPNRTPETFAIVDSRLKRAPPNRELELDGLALLHVTEDLYQRQLYR